MHEPLPLLPGGSEPTGARNGARDPAGSPAAVAEGAEDDEEEVFLEAVVDSAVPAGVDVWPSRAQVNSGGRTKATIGFVAGLLLLEPSLPASGCRRPPSSFAAAPSPALDLVASALCYLRDNLWAFSPFMGAIVAADGGC